jgi:hypothetical protein
MRDLKRNLHSDDVVYGSGGLQEAVSTSVPETFQPTNCLMGLIFKILKRWPKKVLLSLLRNKRITFRAP